MSRRLVAVLAVVGAAAVLPSAAGAAPSATGQAHRAERVCARATGGEYAACSSWIRTDARPNASGTPAGYGPADLQSAYALGGASSSLGAGQTIAIVDAYDDPTAFKDVNIYRAQYGLAALAQCTPSTINASTTACFAKSDQRGGTRYPRTNGGWAQEISLDLDMASAICPKCNLLLVEADSNSFANLGAAVNRAALLGAEVISNSYGGSDASDANYGQYYNHPGIAVTVSSGDAGYGAEYPASSTYVTAVGGTSLSRASNTRGWSETVWSGAGSGCSAYNVKPTWQTDTGCARRTVADVSAVADPNTGVAVYDSTKYQGRVGWLVFGGTSASAPIIAGVYALAGHTGVTYPSATPYANSTALFDVTSGSNGSCGGTYLCTGGTGYDGPSGLGTPNGIGAF